MRTQDIDLIQVAWKKLHTWILCAMLRVLLAQILWCLIFMCLISMWLVFSIKINPPHVTLLWNFCIIYMYHSTKPVWYLLSWPFYENELIYLMLQYMYIYIYSLIIVLKETCLCFTGWLTVANCYVPVHVCCCNALLRMGMQMHVNADACEWG